MSLACKSIRNLNNRVVALVFLLNESYESTQFCTELSIVSLLMSENNALNGHTLKNYLYKMHTKGLKNDFFDFKST